MYSRDSTTFQYPLASQWLEEMPEYAAKLENKGKSENSTEFAVVGTQSLGSHRLSHWTLGVNCQGPSKATKAQQSYARCSIVHKE